MITCKIFLDPLEKFKNQRMSCLVYQFKAMIVCLPIMVLNIFKPCLYHSGLANQRKNANR